MGFSNTMRGGAAALIAYGTSADTAEGETPPDSFVGYAAISWAGA
jgi:hypothetical protein